MSRLYQLENPTVGDLEKGDRIRFPDGLVYVCKGPIRVKKALGGTALRFINEQRLTSRMFSKPLHRTDGSGGTWYEWRYDDSEEPPRDGPA